MTHAAAQTEVSAAVAPAARRGSLWLAAGTLWRREMVRFLRQRTRVVGALATPLLFWLLLGSGLNRSFNVVGQPSGAGYMEYFFTGTVILVLLFTAIFSTISVIEDRREGFMQAVLVAPVPRLAIVLGKVLGGATLATAQGVLVLLLWPLVGEFPGVGWILLSIAVMFLLALGLTALGLCIAWPLDSTTGFHAVMNLFLMPMWFLSGAVFPLHSAPLWLKVLMWANPLTYGQAAFTEALHGGTLDPSTGLPLKWSLAVTAAFVAFIITLAVIVVNRPRKDGTQ